MGEMVVVRGDRLILALVVVIGFRRVHGGSGDAKRRESTLKLLSPLNYSPNAAPTSSSSTQVQRI
ncbi:hypothetical protein CASFOL_020271 [Castilleja foliolosa]|uniref:Secreted protein n=1 Tax=Castilleja foliolosa TaxID=1961234 RepID=A0ABD3D372_9LAMI